mgnify:CR=1 FL=1
MSKLIQKAGFLNPKRAGRYMNYIATRDGVELLDENADSIYMRYIATRPRAEKHGEHGLFGAEDAVDLEKTLGELKAVYVQKDIAYKDVTGAARETMRRIVDQLETVENPPESIRQKLMELALELRTVSGKKQYGYLKKPLKDKVDSIVEELEKLPRVAAYYAVWNDLRDTLDGYYKSKPRQHNPLSQQKEFRAIKNAIIQEAERLCLQHEESSAQTSANPMLVTENTSSPTSHSVRLPSEYLLNSTIRLFHQMVQIFRENAAPPSNPMGIRVDSKRRKKLIQKRMAMGHKQDDHEQAQGYEQSL